MKRAFFLLALTVAGCSDAPTREAEASAPTRNVPPDNRIDCRIGPDAQFERSCTFEREEGPQGVTLTVRKPDGGFRRLRVVTDGRGVVAADGAEPAQVTVMDDRRIEVAIGEDRFRLPATVRR